LGLVVYVDAMPGDWVHPGLPLFRYVGRDHLSDDELRRLRRGFSLGERRSFEQDPRLGLAVLAEIAAKALSPGINDPGTAMDVISTGTGIFHRWVVEQDPKRDPCPHVRFRPLPLADLMEELFTPIAMYGAGDRRLGVRLQQAFAALASLDDPLMTEAARLHSEMAVERALAALEHETDRQTVLEEARTVHDARSGNTLAPKVG
jgi:uncharacterized membrane protein